MKKLENGIIEKIKELYDSGLSNAKIAKELSIGNHTVSKYLKERYGIIKKKCVKKIDQETFEKLWNEGKSDAEIANYFGVKEITIKTFRTRGVNAGKFNVTRYFSQEEHTLSFEQEQMILGSLLGDMSLSKPELNRNVNSRLAIVHSIKQEEYFMQKVEMLGEFMGNYKLYTPAPDKRTGKIYQTWRGNSKAHKVFTDIYNLLYPNGIKTITREYLDKITSPIALAYWFMDDGCYQGNIATDCFSEYEVDLLIEWLYKKWDIECTKQCSKGVCILHILQKSRKHFEELIYPCMPNSMHYKLKCIAESV